VPSGKSYALLFLTLTTVTGAVVAWRQYQELIQLRAAALKPDERADWQKRLWATEKRRTELESEVSALQTKETGGTASIDEPNPTEQPRFNRRNGSGNFRAMMEQPEVQRLVAMQQRASLDGHYASLFKGLALSPDQLDKFKDLLVEKRTSMMDVMAAAREQGINPRRDAEAFSKLVANAQTEIDNNIRETLGDNGFSQYENYEKTMPQRTVVNQLEQRLSYSSTPLTPQQSEQMVSILASTAPNRAGNTPSPLTTFGNGLAAVFGATGGNGGRITDAAVNQSLGVLAAPQIDALKQLQQEQKAQAALGAAIRGRAPAVGAAGAAPATPPPPRTGN
jgi:hypothetical protein